MPKASKPVQVGSDSKKDLAVDASPRQRFQNVGAYVRAHQEMADSPDFIRSADVAMSEYSQTLALKTEIANAAANAMKLQGAQEFLTVLKRLGEVQKPLPPRRDPDNLTAIDQPQRRT